MTKICENCGVEFARTSKTGAEAWETRRFCGNGCHNEQRGREAREHTHNEVAWIMDHDHPQSVAERVGWKNIDDLLKYLRNTGAPQLADRLADNLARYEAGKIGYAPRFEE